MKQKFLVTGMTCSACSAHIEKSLSKAEGIRSVNVNLLANNMMVGIHLCAMGEAFAFAKKAGLDPQTLFDAIKGGFAQSAVMDGKVPKLLSRDFSASARIAVHLKDINNAMDVAAHLGVELPMTEIVKEQMDWMDARGMIDEDQCALAKYYEDAMGVEIK